MFPFIIVVFSEVEVRALCKDTQVHLRTGLGPFSSNKGKLNALAYKDILYNWVLQNVSHE